MIIELSWVWGNRHLEGTNKTLCASGARRKEQCPHKTLSQTYECVGVSGGGLGQQFGLRPNNREGTEPHTSTENWIKDLLSMPPPSRTKPTFPSFSHQEASISLLSLFIREQTE